MPDLTNRLLRIGSTDIFILGGAVEGDITHSGADVIVSSEGTDAAMRSGVSQAIFTAGGPEILSALQAHRPLVPGDVVITGAGQLDAKHIYHAVVVGWGQERRVLQASVWRVVSRCMALAQRSGMLSIAFPSLGTGTAQADRYETHSTMAAACLDALQFDTSLRQILFCFDWPATAETFQRAFLQQRLIRQTHNLDVAGPGDREQLDKDLAKVGPDLLSLDGKIDRLLALVEQLDKTPSITTINNFVNTQGGAYVGGNVDVSGEGTFVGRDDARKKGVADDG